ncbi:MAG: hypothetical protein WCG27_05815, partial [Pseudomonadota bacterium]
MLIIQEPLNDRDWFPLFKKLMGISLLIHVVAAYFSIGYHQLDEHFQILEFVNFKLGGVIPGEMAWEYHKKIRPWIQPFFYYGLTKSMLLAGIKDHFIWVRVYQLFTSVICWLSLLPLALLSYKYCQANYRRYALCVLTFIWFFPY